MRRVRRARGATGRFTPCAATPNAGASAPPLHGTTRRRAGISEGLPPCPPRNRGMRDGRCAQRTAPSSRRASEEGYCSPTGACPRRAQGDSRQSFELGGRLIVGKMPEIPADAAFERIRIGAVPQHLRIMIGLEREKPYVRERFVRLLGDDARCQSHSPRHRRRRSRNETARSRRVMRGAKRDDRDGAKQSGSSRRIERTAHKPSILRTSNSPGKPLAARTNRERNPPASRNRA